MEYRRLGESDLIVSKLCLGTAMFGNRTDEVTSAAMFDLSLESGINFFDCADCYQRGQAEDILGKLIVDCRDDIIIATKLRSPTVNDVENHGSCRPHIFNSIEDILYRLQTDYIDLCYIHHYRGRFVEEMLRALNDLVQQGRIRYLAASNFAAWQFVKTNEISRMHDWAKLVCIQTLFDPVNRQAESDIMPMAKSENIAVVPYNTLDEGLFMGNRYHLNELRRVRYKEDEVYDRENWKIKVAEQIADLAKKRGYNPNSMATAWITSHPDVTSTIIESRNLEQLESFLDSLQVDMSKELWEDISSFSPPPPSLSG